MLAFGFLLASLLCLLAFPPPAATQVPASKHVAVTVIENADYSWVVGNPSMPYLNRLISEYSLATQYYGNTHPSIGDYYMLTTGQIVTNDDNFSSVVTYDNIIRQMIPRGKTWRSYAEDLPAVGWTGGNEWPYLQYHNPFATFSDVLNSSTQLQNLLPLSQFSIDLENNQLPDFTYLLANAVNDAHSCPDPLTPCTEDQMLANADRWLQANLDPLIQSTAFQQDGILIITFDEAGVDNTYGGGRIATVLVGPNVKRGFQSTTFYQQQSGLRLICDALQIACPGAGAGAPQMAEFFIGDTTPPWIVSAQATAADKIALTFSEVLDHASATNPANYSIEGASILGVSLNIDNTTVVLQTSVLAPGASYTVTVNDVDDISGNSIAPNAQKQFLVPGTSALADYRTTVLADKPVAYWRLDETSGTVANDTMARNPATYAGGYTLKQTGALPGDLDAAISLNGTSGYVSAANSSTLSLGDGPLTLEAWVKRASSNRNDVIFHRGTNAFQLRFSVANRLILSKANAGDIAASTVVVTDTNWHHCVATKNGSSVHLYLDGVDVTGVVANQTLSNSTGTLRLGTDNSTFFRGAIDEVAVYNSALSPLQVTNHYAASFFPVGPTALVVSPIQPTEVAVSWINHAANAEATSVERSSDGLTFTPIASVQGGAASYTDTGLIPATPYSYRVRCRNSVGWSAYSNTFSLVTSAAVAPDELVAIALSPSQIGLSWSDTANDQTGFSIERSPDGVAFTQIGTTQGTSYPDTGLAPGTPYYYRVRSFNTIGTSPYSNTAEAITQGATPSYWTNIFADTPVSYWRLGETSGTVAVDQMGRNVGTYSGGYTLGQPGVLSSDSDPSVLLDGSSGYINVANSASLSLGDAPLTLEAWVRRASSNRQDTIIHKGTGAYQLRISSVNRLVLAAANTADIATSTVTITDTNWHHCVATKSGSSVHLYLDGIDVTGTVSPYTLIDAPNSTLRLGEASTAYRLSGNLDEVAIYNFALPADRVVAHFSSAHLPSAPTALSATSSSAEHVDLTWTNTAGNSSGTYIEISADGSHFIQIAAVGKNIASYTDIGLNSGTTYTYRVRAFNAYGTSGYSNIAAATTASLGGVTTTRRSALRMK